MVNQLYLAALSRYPDREGADAGRASTSTSYPRHAPASSQDLFWALLNSNEFVLNH